MSSNKEFYEEVYCDITDNIQPASFFIKYAIDNKGLLGKYDGHIFCPECKCAKLSFVNQTHKNSGFLRKLPSTAHGEKCSYLHDYASQKITQKYFSNLSDKQIDAKLAATIRFLNKTVSESALVLANNPQRQFENPLLINTSKGERYSLRRKRIDLPFVNIDEETIYAFYGKCKLKQFNIPGQYSEKIYFLKIFITNKENNWIEKFTIYRGAIDDKLNENAIYNIAAIGQYRKNGKYNKIKLIRPSAIKYEYAE